MARDVLPLTSAAACPLDSYKRRIATVSIEAGQNGVHEYQGYSIKQNSETARWEIFWRERKQKVDFARVVEAEEWIDDQIPSHRF
jgi:hypothetical protein